MKDDFKINISGIKCSNTKCDYNDENVKIEEYHKLLNKLCPKCGKILLTEEDYKNVKFLLKLVEYANKIC